MLFHVHDAIRMSQERVETSDLQVDADVPYIDDGERGHLMDVYRPKGRSESEQDGLLPLMVNIHGGGLFASYKEVNRAFNCAWSRRGYAVASISYRRIPETTLYHQIEDVMAALRYIKEHSRQWGCDTERCYLTGDSAGALLALYALALEGSEALRTAFGIASSGLSFRAAGLISIMSATQRKDMLSFINDAVTGSEEAHKAYLPYLLEPLRLVAMSSLPPLLLVTSAEDVIRGDTLRLAEEMRSAGRAYRLMDYPKREGRKLVHVFAVQNPYLPESRQVYDEMNTFFTTH